MMIKYKFNKKKLLRLKIKNKDVIGWILIKKMNNKIIYK
jgi:hypothetical protein